MKTTLMIVLAGAAMIGAAVPAAAADGCGRGFHRGPYGHCRPNRGPGGVIVAPGLVIGQFYPGRGYWDGGRYWQHRYRYRHDWRYR